MDEKSKIRFLIIFGIVTILAITGIVVFMNVLTPGQTQGQPPQPQPAPAETK